MVNKCKICEINYTIKEKSKSNAYNTCSYFCFRKTDEYRLKFMTTFLNKRKIVFNQNASLEDLKLLYASEMSKITKTNTYKKHNTIINKYGSLYNGYHKAGLKGLKTRVDYFLLKNNIMGDEELQNLSDIEKRNIFNKFFNNITGHGLKVSDGRLKSAGSKENLKKSYFFANVKTAFKYFSLNLEDSYVMDEKEIRSIVKDYKKAIKFYNHDVIGWKKTHLINSGKIKDDELIKNEDINKLYSELISERYSSNSLKVPNNGYLKSEKGWIFLPNLDIRFFYRSSWEKIILNKLDELKLKNEIKSIFEPERIKYYFDNKWRYYYPDIGIIINNNSKIILEIKPLKKVNEPMNLAKFIAAKTVMQNSFKIISEDIIFDKIDQLLDGEIK